MPSSFDVYLLENGPLLVGRPKGVLEASSLPKLSNLLRSKKR